MVSIPAKFYLVLIGNEKTSQNDLTFTKHHKNNLCTNPNKKIGLLFLIKKYSNYQHADFFNSDLLQPLQDMDYKKDKKKKMKSIFKSCLERSLDHRSKKSILEGKNSEV